MAWKHFSDYYPFVRRINWEDFQQRKSSIFSLLLTRRDLICKQPPSCKWSPSCDVAIWVIIWWTMYYWSSNSSFATVSLRFKTHNSEHTFHIDNKAFCSLILKSNQKREWDMITLLLGFIPAWISNYIYYKVWDEIAYPFLNFNGATVEV